MLGLRECWVAESGLGMVWGGGARAAVSQEGARDPGGGGVGDGTLYYIYMYDAHAFALILCTYVIGLSLL